MDNKFIEERLSCENSNPSFSFRLEERLVEKDLKMQEELQKKEDEEKQRQREEVFGKLFESI